MRSSTRCAALAATLLIALAGCSGDGGDSGDEQEPGSSPSAVAQLPVGAPFGEAKWSINTGDEGGESADSDGDDEDSDASVLVLPDNLLVLQGSEVHSYAPDGKQQWTAPVELFPSEDRSTGDEGQEFPLLRQVSDDVVALIDAGTAEGEGIEKASYTAQVSLISLSDGTVKKVDVAGTESDSPQLQPYGLAFKLPEQEGAYVIVKADGTTEEKTSETSFLGVIGETPVSAVANPKADESSYAEDETPDFDFGSWATNDDPPIKDYTGVRLDAFDDESVLVTWVMSNAGSGDPSQSHTRLITAASGEVVADKVECTPANDNTEFVSSPNGENRIAGPLRIGSDGTAQCAGGGENEEQVTLEAVADDARAFGKASNDAGVTFLADGKVETTEQVEDQADLIGIMNGGIAIHSDEGLLTGNPIK